VAWAELSRSGGGGRQGSESSRGRETQPEPHLAAGSPSLGSRQRAELRIALRGDLHGQWDRRRRGPALRILAPDAFLVSADFSVMARKRIATGLASGLDSATRCILGNPTPAKTNQRPQAPAPEFDLLGERAIAAGLPLLTLSQAGLSWWRVGAQPTAPAAAITFPMGVKAAVGAGLSRGIADSLIIGRPPGCLMPERPSRAAGPIQAPRAWAASPRPLRRD